MTSTPRLAVSIHSFTTGLAFNVGVWTKTFFFAYRNAAIHAAFWGTRMSWWPGIPCGRRLTITIGKGSWGVCRVCGWKSSMMWSSDTLACACRSVPAFYPVSNVSSDIRAKQSVDTHQSVGESPHPRVAGTARPRIRIASDRPDRRPCCRPRWCYDLHRRRARLAVALLPWLLLLFNLGLIRRRLAVRVTSFLGRAGFRGRRLDEPRRRRSRRWRFLSSRRGFRLGPLVSRSGPVVGSHGCRRRAHRQRAVATGGVVSGGKSCPATRRRSRVLGLALFPDLVDEL